MWRILLLLLVSLALVDCEPAAPKSENGKEMAPRDGGTVDSPPVERGQESQGSEGQKGPEDRKEAASDRTSPEPPMESRNPEPGPEPGKTEPAPREPAREVSQPDASPKESGPGDSASSTQLKCAQDKPFPAAVDQSCQQASDCAIVSHMINCCGTSIVLGVNAKTKASFEAAEKTCAATFPRCGCPTLPSKTDDGSQVIGGAKAAVACVAGRCKTYIQGCGAPCASGKSCFPCTSGPTTTFACAKACQTQADCQANDGPNCVNGAFGARFCSTKTVCNAP